MESRFDFNRLIIDGLFPRQQHSHTAFILELCGISPLSFHKLAHFLIQLEHLIST